MLLLILFALFFVVLQNRTNKISVDELINDYGINVVDADSKYINQHLEISGKVKSFVKTEGGEAKLLLESVSKYFEIICLLGNKELEEKAAALTLGTNVTIFGKCLGLTRDLGVDSLSVINFETEKIE